MTIVACIGSRDIERKDGMFLEQIGRYLVESGNQIISGNAKGSDQAFARGGNKIDPASVTLCLPWENYEHQAVLPDNIIKHFCDSEDTHWELAQQAHPAWNSLTQGVRKLMVRNAMIICASEIVVAFPNAKRKSGGTKHGMRIAEMLGLKTYNLADPKDHFLVSQKVAGVIG